MIKKCKSSTIEFKTKKFKKRERIMIKNFQANCFPVLIGSLPVSDHKYALDLVLENTPEIPLWVQLPVYREEGMLMQFMPGFPGAVIEKEKAFIDTEGGKFDKEYIEFYEDYIAVIEKKIDLNDSRFVLRKDTARGFFEFMGRLKTFSDAPVAVKGQITGPITFCTGLTDQDNKAIFYDERIRDAGIKLLALKARWQVKQLSRFGCPVIVFFDEPALTAFGSSAFISISREEVEKSFEEVIDAVHQEGGLAGIHVCANADWSLVLDSPTDIVSFDAYSFFDRFILYEDQIRNFMASDRILAMGIIPTLKKEDIEKETTDSLTANLEDKVKKIEDLGIKKSKIFSQLLITPSCGTGSLSLDHATKVLELTRKVSAKFRNKL